jgi:hypothetical protein
LQPAEVFAPFKQASFRSLIHVRLFAGDATGAAARTTMFLFGVALYRRMSSAGARSCSLVLAARVNHLQNLQTWLKTIAIDLTTAITASDICNNGMELVSTTQRPTSQCRTLL